MEIRHPRICSFYKENPSINIESINLLFIDLFEKLSLNNENLSLKDCATNKENNENINNINQVSQTKIINEIGDLLTKSLKTYQPTSCNSNLPQFIISLNKIFSSSEVFHLKEYDNNHILSLKRFQKPLIYIRSINTEENAGIDDIQNFVKITEDKNCHGIFLSHKSGISSKQNYQIDYHHGNIIIYIHYANYCQHKTKQAVDLIDNLSLKLRELNNIHDDNTIPKSILDDINKEYQLFISQKEALISVYKDCQKKVLSQIDELRFSSLDKYLSTKFTTQIPKQGFKCDLCKCFNANNLKALAAHKRGCVRKNSFVTIAHAL